MDMEILEISIILAMRKAKRDKVFGESKYSLARKVLDRATSLADSQVLVQYTPRGTEIAEEIDLWVKLREYIARLGNADTQYHTWSMDDKARYAFCCKQGSAAVIRDSRFIVLTANSVGIKVITQNFGLEAKFIAVISDEAAMMVEPDQWIPITKLTAHEKIAIVWLIGDHKQMVPLIVSKFALINLFALQIESSLFLRLIPTGYPHFDLLLSGRMHRELLRFPNKRCYGAGWNPTGS